MTNKNEGYVFGLDIGTRSIVGTVGYRMGAEPFCCYCPGVYRTYYQSSDRRTDP